jgi:hypothetical protein
MSTPQTLAETDAAMLASLGIKDYFRFIFLTITCIFLKAGAPQDKLRQA